MFFVPFKSTGLAKPLKNDPEKIAEIGKEIHSNFVRFLDEEISYQEWQASLFEVFDSIGAPPAFKNAFKDLDQFQTRKLMGNYESFLKVLASGDAEKQSYHLAFQWMARMTKVGADPNRPLVIVDMFVKPGAARNHNGVLGHDGRSVLSHLNEIAAP